MVVVPDPVVVDFAQSEEAPVSRRSWLTAAAAAVSAVAVATVVPAGVNAATAPPVKLGTTNTGNKTTTIKDTAASSSAKAIVGRTTYTGTATTAAGVQGISDGKNGSGVIGQANKGPLAAGVWGRSSTGSGIYGEGLAGVVGSGYGGTDSVGVLGYGEDDAAAVAGVGGATLDSVGVLGTTVDGAGWAAYLDGDVFIGGTTYVPESVLSVDHPDAPGERWYQRAAVGSFERLSIISGNTRTGADGSVVVEVPDLFARMHTDFRYQLTVIGSMASASVAREMKQGRFTVRTDRPRVKVSWQVTAVRDDPAARANTFHASVPKRGAERGRMIEPSLYGKAASRASGARFSSGLRRRGSALDAKRRAALSDD